MYRTPLTFRKYGSKLLFTGSLVVLSSFLLDLYGCHVSRECLDDEKQAFQKIPLDDYFYLSSYIIAFHKKYNRWPYSKKEMVDFYNEIQPKMKKKEFVINWDNYKKITFTAKNDYSIDIQFDKFDPNLNATISCQSNIKIDKNE